MALIRRGSRKRGHVEKAERFQTIFYLPEDGFQSLRDLLDIPGKRS